MKKLLKKKRESLNQIMRDEICSTALQIIMESGFSRLTMDRLATRLGIAKGTLYYYFKNKDSLVLETANMISAPLFSALREINKQQISSKNKLLSAAKILSKHFYMYKDFHFTLHEHYGYKFFEQESVIEEREQTRKCIRKIIEDGINKKEFNNISIEAATGKLYWNCNAF